MGSVQRCFDEELVADSIIWHRLQLGVTFVLQDGWLCTTWTLLTLSLRSASRRDCKRQPFPPAAGQTEEKKKSDIQRLAAIWFFFLFFPNKFIELNLVSDIETHTLWKLTYKESFFSAYRVCSGSAEIMPSIETDEKCLRSPAMLVICLSQIPAAFSLCNASIKTGYKWSLWCWHIFFFFFLLVNRKINIHNLKTDFEMLHRHTAILYIFIYIIHMRAV